MALLSIEFYVSKGKVISLIHALIQSCSNMYWALPWPVLHPATKFQGNWFSRFCAILLKEDIQINPLNIKHNLCTTKK